MNASNRLLLVLELGVGLALALAIVLTVGADWHERTAAQVRAGTPCGCRSWPTAIRWTTSC